MRSSWDAPCRRKVPLLLWWWQQYLLGDVGAQSSRTGNSVVIDPIGADAVDGYFLRVDEHQERLPGVRIERKRWQEVGDQIGQSLRRLAVPQAIASRGQRGVQAAAHGFMATNGACACGKGW